MRNVFVLAGLALCMGAAAYAQTTGGWEQFHGTDGNNGRAAAGPDLRVYDTPRFSTAVPDYVDLWGFDPLATGPAVMDGRVFCYGSEGSVSAFDESTGARLWNTPVDDGSALDSFASPSASNGKVYVGSDETLYCMDATTGDILWTYTMDGDIVNASVTIAEDIGLCFLHAWRVSGITRLHAVNIADGTNAWTLDVSGQGQSHVAYNAAVGLVYTPVTDSGRGRIVAIDAAGGSIAWTSEGSFDKPCYGGIAFDAGLNWVVAAGDTGGSDVFCGLLVCDATDGATVRQTADGLLPSANYTPTIGTNGWIYGCGSIYDEPNVFAYNPLTDSVEWWLADPSGSWWDEMEGATYGGYGSSLAYAQDIGGGTSAIYCPSGSWGMWMDGIEEYAMFDAADGQMLATVPMTGGSAALANNNLYFINWDGDLVAFGPPVHIVEVDCSEHGTASTKRSSVVDGGNLTVTFAGDVRDVFVDGVSVGVTNAYTFSSVTVNHTLRVEFFAPPYTIDDDDGTTVIISNNGDDTPAVGGDGTVIVQPGGSVTVISGGVTNTIALPGGGVYDPETSTVLVGLDTNLDGANDTSLTLSRDASFDGATLSCGAVIIERSGAASSIASAGGQMAGLFEASLSAPILQFTLVDGGDIELANGAVLDNLPAGSIFDVISGETYLPNGNVIDAEGGFPVTLNPNGGTLAANVAVCTGTYADLPVPDLSGFTLNGWKTAGGTVVTPATKLSDTGYADLLTATWFSVSGRRYEVPAGETVVSAGSYDAYIYGAETASSDGTQIWAVRGLVTVTVSASGRITAKVIAQSGNVSFNASEWAGIDADGNVFVSMAGKGGWTLALCTRQGRVWGTVTNPAGDTFSIDGARQRFTDKSDVNAKRLLADVARYYTVQLSAPTGGTPATSANLPQGCGYLTMTVKNTGAIRIAGKLADGTSVSQSTRLIPYVSTEGASAAAPFFASVYSRKGSASGLFWLEPAATGSAIAVIDSESGWTLRWENTKDGGFLGYLGAAGASYDKATAALNPAGYLLLAEPGDIPWYEANATAASGLLRWDALLRGIPAEINARGNGVILPKGTAPVLAGSDYDYSAANSARATLSVKQSTGIFTGSFTGGLNVPQASGKARLRQSKAAFAGVLLQNADGTVTLPGHGYATVNATGPTAKKLRLKHAFPVILQPNP